jgi:hypothetical protein
MSYYFFDDFFDTCDSDDPDLIIKSEDFKKEIEEKSEEYKKLLNPSRGLHPDDFIERSFFPDLKDQNMKTMND